MADIGFDNASAIVTAVVSTVAILTAGAVNLAARLQVFFLTPIRDAIVAYLKDQSANEKTLAETIERLESKIESIPRCPNSVHKD